MKILFKVGLINILSSLGRGSSAKGKGIQRYFSQTRGNFSAARRTSKKGNCLQRRAQTPQRKRNFLGSRKTSASGFAERGRGSKREARGSSQRSPGRPEPASSCSQRQRCGDCQSAVEMRRFEQGSLKVGGQMHDFEFDSRWSQHSTGKISDSRRRSQGSSERIEQKFKRNQFQLTGCSWPTCSLAKSSQQRSQWEAGK